MSDSKIYTGEIPTPQPEVLATKPKSGQLFIGVPKETSFQETRVALSPSSVRLLTGLGNRVLVESEAGMESGFSDLKYSEAGAEIVYETEKIFEANIILKVAPPTPKEIEFLKFNQVLFSPLHLPSMSRASLQQLINKKISAIAYEYVKDPAGYFPIVRIMSEIAGGSAILIAAEYLSKSSKGKGVLLGGISALPPAKVVVLGAGVVGEYVARSAIGLGADVRVFDNNLYKLMRLQNNLSRRVYTSVILPNILAEELRTADVVVGAIHAETGRTPIFVTEDMVQQMQNGSVIVDVSIDQGGCIETSELTNHTQPTFVKHGIIHYCVPNIAARVPHSASRAFSNVITGILSKAHEYGGFENLLREYPGICHGAYIYRGKLTNQFLSERFDLKYTDIELLMAANYG